MGKYFNYNDYMSNELENNTEINNADFKFPENTPEKPKVELRVDKGRDYQQASERDLSEVRGEIDEIVVNNDRNAEVSEEFKELGIISEKKVEIDGQEYLVRYVTKDFIGLHFGEAYEGTGIAYVRADLPDRVKKFVESHELYHLTDPKFIPGSFISEVRANFYPGMRDPIGLVLTLIATLRDPDRRAYYIQFLKEKLVDRREIRKK